MWTMYCIALKFFASSNLWNDIAYWNTKRFQSFIHSTIRKRNEVKKAVVVRVKFKVAVVHSCFSTIFQAPIHVRLLFPTTLLYKLLIECKRLTNCLKYDQYEWMDVCWTCAKNRKEKQICNWQIPFIRFRTSQIQIILSPRME